MKAIIEKINGHAKPISIGILTGLLTFVLAAWTAGQKLGGMAADIESMSARIARQDATILRVEAKVDMLLARPDR